MTAKEIILLLLLQQACCLLLTAQSDSLRCNGDFIVSHGNKLFTLVPDIQAGTFARILKLDLNTSGTEYDALAYRKADNCIYGIDYNAFPNTRLFKIDPAGRLIILDTLINTRSYYWGIVAGDITPDQRYLVVVRNMYTETGVTGGLGGMQAPGRPNLIYLIDLESDDYELTIIEGETSGQPAGVRIGDLAIDPSNGLGYTYDVFTNRMVTIDPFTGAIDNTSFPPLPLPINRQFGALFFTPFGELIGHHRRNGETMYYLDKEKGTAEEILFLDSPASRITDLDGCSCPYTVAMQQEVRPDTAFTCQSVEIVCRIAYWIEGGSASITFRDSFPAGLTVEEVIYNPYGGTVTGLGTSDFRIENFIPIIGVDSLVLRVSVPPATATGLYQCQASLAGLDLRAANDGRTTIRSDYPRTYIQGDPTPLYVSSLDDYLTATDHYICPDTSLLLQAVPAAQAQHFTYQWFDGSTTSSVLISQPGDYQLTVSDGCTDHPLTIQVEDGSIQVQIEPEIYVAFGDSVQLIPTIISTSAPTSYTWMASDSSLLSCLHCAEPIVTPQENESMLRLSVTNTAGCSASESIRIYLQRPIFAPNVFSPNQDGINDRFFLQTPEPIPVQVFQVFNRWGELVFETKESMTNDSTAGWNGLSRGLQAPAGTYLWRAVLLYDGQVAYSISGEVMVIR